MIAIVTYNALEGLYLGPCALGRQTFLVLTEAFTEDGRKAPELVRPDDLRWQMLLKHRGALERVIVFAGKKESGALEVIRLVMETFDKELEKVYFVLCDHNLHEKTELIHSLGGSEKNYMSFSDHYRQCKEGVILKGLMLEYVHETPFTEATVN